MLSIFVTVYIVVDLGNIESSFFFFFFCIEFLQLIPDCMYYA